MDERELQGIESEGHHLASEVSERVRTIISAAEAAASAVRHEAEQAAQVRRRTSEQEAQHLLEDAQREADALLTERVRRISELSDSVIERAESIVARLDRADEVRRQLQALVDSLGESAARLASEMRSEAPVAADEAPVAARAPVAEPAAVDEPAVLEEEDPAAEVEVEVVVAEVEVEEEPSTVVPLRESRDEPEEADEVDDDELADGDDELADAAAERESDDQLAPRLVALQMAVAGGNRGEVEEHLRETFGIDDPGPVLDDVFGRGTDATKRVVWPKSGDGAA